MLLFGHSGGGPATSFYQAVAETGPSYCQGPNKLVECANTLAGLPKADGLILVDAHPGVSVNGLRSLNAAVLDERDPRKIDPALDPFSPANGYDPKTPHYSDAFKQKYFKAQADRMNRLIDEARRRLAAMKAGSDALPRRRRVPRGAGGRGAPDGDRPERAPLDEGAAEAAFRTTAPSPSRSWRASVPSGAAPRR